jgi:hypothetical protein
MNKTLDALNNTIKWWILLKPTEVKEIHHQVMLKSLRAIKVKLKQELKKNE